MRVLFFIAVLFLISVVAAHDFSTGFPQDALARIKTVWRERIFNAAQQGESCIRASEDDLPIVRVVVNEEASPFTGVTFKMEALDLGNQPVGRVCWQIKK